MAGGCNVWAGSGSRLLVLIDLSVSGLDGCQVWVWDWLEASSFLQMVP